MHRKAKLSDTDEEDDGKALLNEDDDDDFTCTIKDPKYDTVFYWPINFSKVPQYKAEIAHPLHYRAVVRRLENG